MHVVDFRGLAGVKRYVKGRWHQIEQAGGRRITFSRSKGNRWKFALSIKRSAPENFILNYFLLGGSTQEILMWFDPMLIQYRSDN